MLRLGRLKLKHGYELIGDKFSFEANAEIYKKANYDAAQRVKKVKLKVLPDENPVMHRHYIGPCRELWGYFCLKKRCTAWARPGPLTCTQQGMTLCTTST